MRDIKKVLESQGNMHNMVELQDHLAFKLMYSTRSTSNLGDLHINGKIRR
jgi:hypothetical protein